MTTLARCDQDALKALEEVIERGLECFVEVGNALLQIRETRLYRGEYGDFKTYCCLRWGMTAGHARNMMDAAEVAGHLKLTESTKGAPQIVAIPSQRIHESQMRPLVPLDPHEQIEAWNQAKEETQAGKLPTAEKVQEVVKRIRPERASLDKIVVGLHGKVTVEPEQRIRPTLPPRIQPNGQTPDSAQLQKLKYDWNESNDADHEAFRIWIGEQ